MSSLRFVHYLKVLEIHKLECVKYNLYQFPRPLGRGLNVSHFLDFSQIYEYLGLLTPSWRLFLISAK